MNMGDRIKERRIALGMTQGELGDKLGLQKSGIAKYESGRVQNIKRSTIQKMAVVLECSPSYLMGLDDPEGGNYYFNSETAAIAQQIYENKYLQALFDAARDASPETLQTSYDLLVTLKKRERHEE